jgi:uncharacterized SAM-binding protein YcdF (DUF218 family)
MTARVSGKRAWWTLKTNLVIFAVGAIVAVAGFWHAGSFLSAPTGIPLPADCIVALGGDSGDRIVKVLELYRHGLAPVILLTGVEDSPAGAKTAYLTWRAEYLVKAGVPTAALLYDVRSANSMEEAINTLALARARGWKRVMVVSDPPHMRRLSLAWSKAFRGAEPAYTLVASDPPWWRERAWWQSERAAQYIITEYIKIGYYLARY